MAIKLKNRDDDEILAEINIIPLVDVSLVLLIVFIVTVNHILTPSINLKLPQSSNTQNVSQVESVNISITSEGIVYLENDIVRLKELKERVSAIQKKEPSRGIILNVDKSVHFQSVVDILDIFSGMNITKLDIRTLHH